MSKLNFLFLNPNT